MPTPFSLNKPSILLDPHHCPPSPPLPTPRGLLQPILVVPPSDPRGRHVGLPFCPRFATPTNPGWLRSRPGCEPVRTGTNPKSEGEGNEAHQASAHTTMRLRIVFATHECARSGSREGQERRKRGWWDSARCACWPEW